MKEFIIIPILLVLYFYAVNFFVYSGILSAISTSVGGPAPEGPAVVSVGQFASIQVTRGYLFGFYRLPVFTSDLGDISIYHNTFFAFVSLLTVFLIYREVKLRNRNYMPTYNPFLKRNQLWKRIGWALLMGLIFGIVAFFFSAGEWGSSLALGMLVAYLEFRLSSK